MKKTLSVMFILLLLASVFFSFISSIPKVSAITNEERRITQDFSSSEQMPENSIEYMNDPYMWDLCDELLADKGHYLRTWYDGEWCSGYVDAIIGITAQATPKDPDTIGVAPSLNELNQGKIFVLLKWQVYWEDDNLVQHEISHLYYVHDHPESESSPCCAMAYHTHFQLFIWEDGLWWVFCDVRCAMTTYSWCTSCHQTVQQNSGRYPIPQCAMKTLLDGYFYVPNLGIRTLKLELLFDGDGPADQFGGASPYGSLKAWPDGNVEGKDNAWVSGHYNTVEGDSNWDYMADIKPDRRVDGKDIGFLAKYYGTYGIVYIYDLTGVTVVFNTGQEVTPSGGWVEIPSGATYFNVFRNDVSIGALITFW